MQSSFRGVCSYVQHRCNVDLRFTKVNFSLVVEWMWNCVHVLYQGVVTEHFYLFIRFLMFCLPLKLELLAWSHYPGITPSWCYQDGCQVERLAKKGLVTLALKRCSRCSARVKRAFTFQQTTRSMNCLNCITFHSFAVTLCSETCLLMHRLSA